MKFSIIIPARFASERLPGKALSKICGRTMIERVYDCAKNSEANRVVVATDDKRIFDVVVACRGEAVMTSADHLSGTDRLHEAVCSMGFGDEDIVVNVQGDEPLIPPAVINQVAANLSVNPHASVATLSEDICDIETVFDANAVKVICDDRGYALYFSRASIPWSRDGYSKEMPELSTEFIAQRHIGIYAYRVKLLKQFVKWEASSLEKCEKLEQLRILSNGQKIHVAKACENVPGGVDTPEDLQRVCDIFMNEAEQ